MRADPESIASPSENLKEAGSRVEGFCIPQFIRRESEIDRVMTLDIQEHWQPDRDTMTVNDSIIENDEKVPIPIFTPEHAEDDLRYAKLRLSKEWKDHRPRYNDFSYLHHAFLLPSADHPMAGHESKCVDGQNKTWSYSLHGPVRKLQSDGFPNFELDETGVFKYPIAWPEPAMQWLVRAHPSGWPSSELVQEIFELGCHLAPVGRGKRLDEPIELLNYCRNPEMAEASTVLPAASNEVKWVMDETEWRTSFSLAENMLGESVSPVQRHIMVLLKMIKKFYFPDVISTYYLKNLLFWECEKKEEEFWTENNSANCLLFMLDRLQESLESHQLPHYIIPESNVLKYEDPTILNEAAVIVAEVRRNILPKTVSLLKRLQSLSYQSNTYLKDLGLQSENHLLRMQDKALPAEDRKGLLMSIHSIFVGKCKEVIASLRRITPTEGDQEIEMLLNVALYAYQSMLARNLCKLWFLKSDENYGERKNDDEFKSFVKEEVKDLFFDDDFLALALVFSDRTRDGIEPSLEIPSTSAMGLLRGEQMKIAQKNVEEAMAPMKGTFDCLKTSDYKQIADETTRKLKGKLDITTKEEIKRLFNVELSALFKERMEERKINTDFPNQL